MYEMSCSTELANRRRLALARIVPFVIACIVFALTAASARAQAPAVCDIDDVVFLAQKERLPPSKIRQECSSVRNAGVCSLLQVMRLASEQRDANNIKNECRSGRVPQQEQQQQQQFPQQQQQQFPQQQQQQLPRPASVCLTPFGSCPMMVPLMPGSSCYCATPRGQFWGTAQ